MTTNQVPSDNSARPRGWLILATLCLFGPPIAIALFAAALFPLVIGLMVALGLIGLKKYILAGLTVAGLTAIILIYRRLLKWLEKRERMQNSQNAQHGK